MSLSLIGASLNAGDEPAYRDVIDKRGAAQYHELHHAVSFIGHALTCSS